MDIPIITTGLAALAEADADFARAFETYGTPAPRIRPAGYETFLSIIVSQQLSTEVAGVIMGRVKDLMPSLSAAAMLALEDEDLRQAGLSYRKIGYAKGLAEAMHSGRFNIAELESLDNSDAIARITELKGFGRWSAEIYLMFSLGRRDIFPADDLALQVALGRLKKLPTKPTPKQARELVEHWSPWRSVGSLFLWHYYRGAPG